MAKSTTISSLVDGYLRDRVARGEILLSTARGYGRALRLFGEVAGDRPASQVGARQVERWLEARAHLRPSTRRTQFSALRVFCDHLVARRVMRRNPTRDVKGVRTPRSVPRALDVEQIGRLLAACPDARARAIVWVMVGCGLRCLEVEGLEAGDWDRNTEVILVRRGKGGHQRVVPVPPEVAGPLEDYLAEHPATVGPLIRSYRTPGRALDRRRVSEFVSLWLYAAGVKRAPNDGISAHALRHTCASDVLDRCGDLRVVQELLGHAHLSSTAIYLRRAGLGRLREAMAGRDYRLAS